MRRNNKKEMRTFYSSKIKQNINCRGIVEYNSGDLETNIAFVFACPGQEEKNNGKVVSGNTGSNFEILLQQLKNENYPGICHVEESNVRYQYCITNASQRVYYKGYNGSNRTLPYVLDLYSEENMNRLRNELIEKEVIICFGKSAHKVINKIKKYNKDLNWEIIETIHLGFQSLNQMTLPNVFDDQDSSERTKERIKKVAKEILSTLKR